MVMDRFDEQQFQKAVQVCKRLSDQVASIKREESIKEQEVLDARHKAMLARKEALCLEQQIKLAETSLSLCRVKSLEARKKLEYETNTMQRKSRKRPRDEQ